MPGAELLQAGPPAELLRELNVVHRVVLVRRPLPFRARAVPAGVGDEHVPGFRAQAEQNPAALDEIAYGGDVGDDRFERPVRERDREV